MSKSVEERVVRMEFDNKEFEKNVAQSLNTLNRLEKSVDGIDKRGASFANLASSIKNVDFHSMEQGISRIANRFTLWGRMVDDVRGRISSMVGQIATFPTKVYDLAKTGGISRALNIENAKFQLEGLGVAWKDIEDDINYGVKDTAYGLDAAAKAASQLVASNVQLGAEMKASLRGISGVAAMTNSSFEDISQVFTRVAGNGRVMANDLYSLSSRGLNAAAALAKQLGKTEAEVREMIHDGQVDFKMFSKAMDDAFGEHAKEANKTFEGAMSNVKAALSRTGQAFAESGMNHLHDIFVDLIPLINRANKSIQSTAVLFDKWFGNIVDDFRKFLETNKEGLAKSVNLLVRSFFNAMQVATKFGKIVGKVLKDVFGIKADSILELSKSLYSLTYRMLESKETFEIFKEGLTLVAEVAKSVWNVFKDVVYITSPMMKVVRSVARLIITTLGTITGALHKTLNGKNGPTTAVKSLHNLVDDFATFLSEKVDWLTERVGGVVEWIQGKIQTIKERFAEFKQTELGQNFMLVFGAMKNALKSFGAFMTKTALPKMLEGLAKAFTVVGGALMSVDWDGLFGALKTGFGWIKDGLDWLTNKLSGGKFETFGSIFTGATSSINDFAGSLDKTTGSIDKISGKVDEASGSVDTLFSKFDDRGIGGSIKSVSETLFGASENADEMGTNLDKLKTSLKGISDSTADTTIDALGDVTEKGKELFDRLYTAVGSPDPGSIMGIAFGFAGTKGLLSLSNLMDGLGSAAKSIGDLPKTIGDGFKSLAGGFLEMQKSMGKSQIIKSFAILMGVLAASIIGIAIAAQKYDIVEAAGLLAAFAGGMVVALTELMAATKITNAAKIRAVGALALALSGAALLLALAVKAVMSIPWDQMSWKQIGLGLGVMAAVIIGLGFIAAKLQGFGSFSISNIGNGDKKGGGSGFLGVIGVVLALSILLGQIRKMEDTDVEHLKQSLIPISGLLVILGVIAQTLSNNGFKIAGVGAGIFLMITSLVSLMLALGGLVLIVHKSKPVELGVALGIIVVTMGLLVGLMAATRLAGKDAKGAAAAVAAIGASILMISIALNIMTAAFSGDKKKMQAAWQGIGAIMLLVAEFGALIALCTRFGGFSSNPAQLAAPILAIGGAILMISVSMMVLSTVDADKIQQMGRSIALIIASMTLIIVSVKQLENVKVGPMIAVLAGIGLMIAALVGLSAAAKYFGDDFDKAMQGLGAGVIALVVGMYAASKLSDKLNWKGLLSFAGTVAIVVAGLVAVALMIGDPGKIVASGIGLGVALAAVGVAMWGVSKLTDKFNWKGLLMLAGTVTILTAAIAILSNVGKDVGSIVAAGVALAATLLAVTLISNLANGSAAGAAAVLLLSGAIAILAISFQKLQDVDLGKLIPVLGAMAVTLVVLVAACAGLSLIAAPVAIGSAVLLLLGVALNVTVLAFKIAIETINSFSDTLVNLGMRAPAIIHSIEALVNGIKSVVLNAIADVVELIPGVGDKLASGMRAAADEAEKEMQKASLQATAEETMYQTNQKMLRGLKGDSEQNKSAGIEVMTDFLGGIQDKVPDLSNLGEGMMSGDDGLLGGLTSGMDELMPNVEDMMGENGLAGAMDVSDLTNISGISTMEGFETGLGDISTYFDMGAARGDAVAQGFNSKQGLDVNSPSKKTRKTGRSVDEGLALGIKDGIKDIDNAIERVADSTVNGLNDSIDTTEAGKNVAEGLNKGLNDKKTNNKISKSSKKLGKNIENSFNKQMKIHSPSKIMEEAGKNICLGIAQGITKNMGEVTDALALVGMQVQKYASEMYVGDETFTRMLETQSDFLISEVGVSNAVDAARLSVTYLVDSMYKGTEAYRQHLDTIEQLRQQIAFLSADTKKNSKAIVEAFDKVKEESKAMADEAKSNFNDLRNGMISAAKDMFKLGNVSYDMTVTFGGRIAELVASYTYQAINALDNFERKAKTGLNKSLTPFKNFANGLKTTINSSLDSLKDFNDGLEDTLNASLKALQTFERKSKGSLVGSLDIFGSYERNEKWESNGAFLDHLDETLEAAEKKLENFEKVKALGLSDEVIAHIKEMGSEGDKLLEELASYDQEQIEKVNKAWARQQELTAEQFEDPTDAIFRSMTEEIEAAQKRIDDFAALEKTQIDKRFLEELKEMGDEGNDIIEGLLKMSDDQIKQFNELYAKELDLATPTKKSPLEAILKPMEENLQKAGERVSKLAQLATLGIEKAYLKELSDMGEDADALIDTFLEMTDEERSKFNSLYKQQSNMKKGSWIGDPVQAMFDELDNELEKAQERVDNFSKLKAMGIHDAYLQELADMGEDSTDIIENLLKFSAEQVEEFNKKYAVMIKFKEDKESGIDAMLRTMQEKITNGMNLRVNMDKALEKGLSNEIVQQIVAMGDEGAQILAEIADADASKIEEIKNAFGQIAEMNETTANLAKKSSSDILKSLEEDLSKDRDLGKKIAQMRTMGFNEDVIKYVKDMGEDASTVIEGFLSMSEEQTARANEIFKEKLKREGEIMQENMNAAQLQFKTWTEELTKLAEKGVSQGVIVELMKLGPSSLEQLQIMNAKTQPELLAWDEQYRSATKTAVKCTDDAIIAMAANGLKAAGSFADGLALYDLAAHQPDIANNYISYINGMGIPINEAAYNLSMGGVYSLAKGFEDAKANSEAKGAAGGAARGAYDAMNDAANESPTTEEIGKNMLGGFRNGLRNNFIINEIKKNSESMVRVAKNQMITTAETRSPSRFTIWLGEMMGQGLVVGMENKEADVENASESFVEKVKTALSSIDNSAMTDGITDGLLTGMDSIAEPVVNSLAEVLSMTYQNARDFSVKWFPNVGVDIDTGLMVGMDHISRNVIQKLNDITAAAYIEDLNWVDNWFPNIGVAMDDGLVRGINSGRSSVINAAVSVAVAAYAAACAALGVHSPSKAFAEIGMYTDMGFAQGILANADLVEDAADTMATDALTNMQSVIQQINDSIFDEISDPVIRPTIDTSDIERAALLVNGMFNDSQAKIRADLQANTDSNQNQGSTVNFYQTNNSPKALSRTEIYRQTNNQLRQIRSALS